MILLTVESFMKKITISSHNIQRIEQGHPWIYRSQIRSLQEGIEAGDIVGIQTDQKKWVGLGYYNPLSEISIRLVSRQKIEFNKEFLKSRFLAAKKLREELLGNLQTVRWINSESDQLPGLVVDAYAGFFVIQITTLGMERVKDWILECLQEIFQPRGIYERNDFPTRSLEGLPLRQGNLQGEEPPPLISIEENGSKFRVDIRQGHKTGFYLDQKENRDCAARLARGKSILDCFTYTGGFAITALTHGAQSVLAVDISSSALTLARENAKLNQVEDRWQDMEGNGFDILKLLSSQNQKFDMIILDPPSFTKNRASVERALAGYKEINIRALKMINPGGILVTASCSHHIDELLFINMVKEAAKDSRRSLMEIARGRQASDHPILAHIPETRYLSCLFYRVDHVS